MRKPIRTNMKIIQNRTTSIPKAEGVMATYADLFITILNKPLQKMVNLSDMRRDLKLIDKMEDSEKIIEVSDDEFKYLHKSVENSEWAIKHLDILGFADYINSLA